MTPSRTPYPLPTIALSLIIKRNPSSKIGFAHYVRLLPQARFFILFLNTFIPSVSSFNYYISMEFKYCDCQNQRTSSPTPRPFPTLTYKNSDISKGSSQDMPSITPRIRENADTAGVGERRDRREIIANEMIWRRGLKEKVLGISMQGLGMFSFGEPISMSFNPRMNSINHVNNADKDTRQFSTLTNKDKIIILKKSKQEWRCTLCHITTTSEKDLNDHGQEKKNVRLKKHLRKLKK
ncbi:hypothetical protein JHK87_047704 [Glycine soja]|uniref:C2H2-type domain-containing protein n=1 Tax=Glycine max TaxID=3847 RepID=A0A0R0FEZ7_SOYBN|nr:hypothetical protein JHK87_047704 [Glycine soja]